MVPARRLYELLLLGLAIALAIAVLWPNEHRVAIALMLLILYDLVVLGLAIADATLGQKHRVTVARDPLQRLSIARDNPVALSVQSQSQPAIVQIRDDVPSGMAVSETQLQATLSANTQATLTYTVHPTQRGEFRWGAIHLRQLSPRQLMWMSWSVPQFQTVAVYPDLIGLRSLSIQLTLQSSGNIRQAKRLGGGTEFAELREYATGDDPRLIDWKATARRSRPLIRVLEPEQEQTLIILLDRGRLMTAQVQGVQRFDWGLNAALSLALAGLHRGDRVGVAVFDRQIHTWIPPERGNAQLPKLLERLAPIQPELLEPDYVGTITRIINQQTRRALVVMITDIVDVTASTELLAALSRLTPRYLPFCVTLRDPEVDRIAAQITHDTESTYARAVALDLMAQRQDAFAKLKQKGVMVLDAPANLITQPLIDEYLRLKARGKL